MSKESKSKRMKFVVYQSERLMNTSIDELDLSPRAYNCLMRAGLFTIGAIISDIEKEEDLLKYRNLGKNSANEIMRKIFLYHYGQLQGKQKDAYHKRVAIINGREDFSDCLMAGGCF